MNISNIHKILVYLVWGLLAHIYGWSSLFLKLKLNCSLIMMNGQFMWWVSGTMINLYRLIYLFNLLYDLFKPILKLNYASVWHHRSYSKRWFGKWKKYTRSFGKHFLCKKIILLPFTLELFLSSFHSLREM